MFISKVTLKNGPELFNLLKHKTGNDAYTDHQLLWNLFPNDGIKKRDFLFHKDESDGMPQFLVVSKTEPVEIRGISVVVKPYSPQLAKGQKLAFALVANPVVAKKTEGKKNSTRHDVWMDAKQKAKELNLNPKEKRKHCEKKTKEWLISRSESFGFSLEEDSVIIDGYMQHRLYKRNSPKSVRFSSVHFEGIITVTNPELFCNTLFNGIGKSKSFGCGLLLVRRI